MITIIAPHARPEFSNNLLGNFLRQPHYCRLLVVENGAALGCFPRGIPGVTVVSSENHQADARNAGLTWLRANGGGAWAMFDDDDYYGPCYLLETERALQVAEIVGKPWSFVMLDDGLYRFSVNRCETWASDFELTGGTLAARSVNVSEFERRMDDDIAWCKAMRGHGVQLWACSPFHYCYDRRGNRTRVAPGNSIVTRRMFGAAEFYGAQALSAVCDTSIRPIAHRSVPSDAEVFAGLIS